MLTSAGARQDQVEVIGSADHGLRHALMMAIAVKTPLSEDAHSSLMPSTLFFTAISHRGQLGQQEARRWRPL